MVKTFERVFEELFIFGVSLLVTYRKTPVLRGYSFPWSPVATIDRKRCLQALHGNCSFFLVRALVVGLLQSPIPLTPSLKLVVNMKYIWEIWRESFFFFFFSFFMVILHLIKSVQRWHCKCKNWQYNIWSSVLGNLFSVCNSPPIKKYLLYHKSTNTYAQNCCFTQTHIHLKYSFHLLHSCSMAMMELKSQYMPGLCNKNTVQWKTILTDYKCCKDLNSKS